MLKLGKFFANYCLKYIFNYYIPLVSSIPVFIFTKQSMSSCLYHILTYFACRFTCLKFWKLANTTMLRAGSQDMCTRAIYGHCHQFLQKARNITLNPKQLKCTMLKYMMNLTTLQQHHRSHVILAAVLCCLKLC